MSFLDNFVANKVNENNQPVCPMKGCFEPVEPGKGDAAMIAPDVQNVLLSDGLIACVAQVVIVHKGGVCPDEHDWPERIRIALLRSF